MKQDETHEENTFKREQGYELKQSQEITDHLELISKIKGKHQC